QPPRWGGWRRARKSSSTIRAWPQPGSSQRGRSALSLLVLVGLQALQQGVPSQEGALDAHGVLLDPLEGGEVAEAVRIGKLLALHHALDEVGDLLALLQAPAL